MVSGEHPSRSGSLRHGGRQRQAEPLEHPSCHACARMVRAAPSLIGSPHTVMMTFPRALSRVQSCRGDQSHRGSGDGRGRDRHKRAVSQAMDLGNVGSRQRGGHDGLWRRLSGDTGKALARLGARRSGREIARRCTPYQGRDPDSGPRPARQNPPQSSETMMLALPHRMCSVILVGVVKGPYPFVTLPTMLTR